MRFFIELAYLGTRYHGWQRQKNTPLTVQGVLEEALAMILRKDATEVETTGQGRTDTGVHARQMFAHVELEEITGDLKDLSHKLNRLLPNDIAVRRIFPVAHDLHARFSATERQYAYRIHWAKDPFIDTVSAQIAPQRPDFEAMNACEAWLLAQGDFASFQKVGATSMTTICDLRQARWELTSETSAVFHTRADRYLRNMVRAMVGTLLEIGAGRRDATWLEEVFASGDRSAAGQSMPAHGLTLEAVRYPGFFEE